MAENIVEALSAAEGGAVSTIALFPLEVLTTTIQASKNTRYVVGLLGKCRNQKLSRQSKYTIGSSAAGPQRSFCTNVVA